MEEIKSEVQESSGGIRYKEMENDSPTPDVHNVGEKIQRAKEIYIAYAGVEEKPTKSEVLGWYFYGLCSYFVHTVLIPIVFPLIISQTVSDPPEPPQGWSKSYMGLNCRQNQTELYEGLIHKSIKLSGSNFSPLEWTSVSWAGGLILSAPILATLSILLDYCHNQQLIAGVATAVGALFCLPAGFFQKSWIFPPYVAAIVAANAICAAAHARHLGLMIRGYIGSTIRKSQFPDRNTFASWLSLYSTAAGSLGAAILSSFVYHMLRKSDYFTSLWVVSIFSGLIWGLGMVHIFTTTRSRTSISSSSNSIPKTHIVSIFNYPHAAGSLAGVFLSAFTTMCIFAASVLYATGYLCVKPKTLLYLWLTYFMFPLVSLPLAHPLQQIIKADAVKMQLLGFLFAILTSGFGFYYRNDNWHKHHLLVFAGIQSTATGLLHAFGRVLWLDCSPAGKEGAFSVWFSWMRALGTCAGFAVATSMPGNIGKAFGIAFCAGIIGMVILIFGNISSFGGAKAAGHIVKSEKASPVHGLDNGGAAAAAAVEVKAPPAGMVEV